jgi:hypothetical protein
MAEECTMRQRKQECKSQKLMAGLLLVSHQNRRRSRYPRGDRS